MGLLGKKETRESESEVVRILREAGAVIFVKTNVPSGMMVSRSLLTCPWTFCDFGLRERRKY